MRIILHSVTIGEIIDGFASTEKEGVIGYGGRLNIRPPYQREFIYDARQQVEVVNSVFRQFPLNVMYWVRNKQGTYEMLDGQQRTLSICSYAYNGFAIVLDGELRMFTNLTPEQRKKFLEYPLQIYICEDGTQKEQLDWFRVINIAGERLLPQELRNAVYTGPWVASARARFSKNGCVAYRLGSQYMNGSPIRQDYLQTVLGWISGDKIDIYMAQHQSDANCDAEWQYFQNVIHWVQTLFPKYRREMKGIAWGALYNECHDRQYSATQLEKDAARLFMDDDVTNKKGVYEYLLTGRERALSVRAFSDSMKREAYERQQGRCAKCGKEFNIEKMQGDHILPWSKGGHTTPDNCQMLCQACNATKSDN